MTMATGKRVGYIRVSAGSQHRAAVRSDQARQNVYGQASGKDIHRRKLKAALDFLREGDRLVVHSMDRLALKVEDILRWCVSLRLKVSPSRSSKSGSHFAATTRRRIRSC